ncbi:MAG: hypothetical protein HYY84_20050 [Deltaproteobacteria bacterium]|nr:hypothetical protein [Deltaproteobacteria bacterium]
MKLRIFFMVAGFAALSCGGGGLPGDVQRFESRCVKMNANPIAIRVNDPHPGTKDVYACNLDAGTVKANTRPFPDGTLIVKSSTRIGEDFIWLVATARKQAGEWQWDEYTRNFSNETFARVPVSESTCTDCHATVATSDWIYTTAAP